MTCLLDRARHRAVFSQTMVYLIIYREEPRASKTKWIITHFSAYPNQLWRIEVYPNGTHKTVLSPAGFRDSNDNDRPISYKSIFEHYINNARDKAKG